MRAWRDAAAGCTWETTLCEEWTLRTATSDRADSSHFEVPVTVTVTDYTAADPGVQGEGNQEPRPYRAARYVFRAVSEGGLFLHRGHPAGQGDLPVAPEGTEVHIDAQAHEQLTNEVADRIAGGVPSRTEGCA